MDEVRFLLFEKKRVKRVDRDLLAFTVFAIAFTFIWLNDEFIGWLFLSWFLKSAIIVGTVVYMYFLIYSINEKERLDGNFIGHISFGMEVICAGELKLMVENIGKMDFHVNEYDGSRYSSYRSIEPKVSNGTNNQIRLIMKDRSELKFNFHLNYEDEFEKKMRDFLITYHLKDKISFLALIQYIGISDSYERIQEFKKELEALRETEA